MSTTQLSPDPVCRRCGARIEPAPGAPADSCAACLLEVALSAGSSTNIDLTQFEHYRILTNSDGNPVELGRGSMGVTYKAFDERLRIEIALKVIKSAWGDDRTAQALFAREARAAARIRHPNVASVLFLSGNPDHFFYAMEFVAGVSLRDWTKARGLVAPDLAIELGIQLARGLGAIHDVQIVHRDLKPSNVMVFPSRASTHSNQNVPSAEAWQLKIIDFGLARVLDAAASGDSGVLATQGFKGTALYASPEQCHELEDVDGRADLYSLGCILWEMLCGKPPFIGRTYLETLNMQATAEIPVQRIAHLPAPLKDVMLGLLAKDREKRLANADVVVQALEHCRARLSEDSERPDSLGLGATISDRSKARSSTAKVDVSAMPAGKSKTPRVVMLVAIGAIGISLAAWFALNRNLSSPATETKAAAKVEPTISPPDATRSTVNSRKSVAILPFANLSSDKENEYFVDGVHEDLLSNLAKIRNLKVISRSSVMGYRGKPQNPRLIGEELGVATVVEGSVRRVGNKVRVTAQLIDAGTHANLWAETFDGDLADIFSIQSQIAQDIAKALNATLSPEEKSSLDRKPTADPIAYEYYLKGRAAERGEGGLYFDADGGTTRLDEAITWYEKAVAKDPGFAQPYAALAHLHAIIYEYGSDQSPGRAGKIREAALAAMRANPDLPESHLALGIYISRIERNLSAALQEYRKAEALSPNTPDLNDQISLILDRLNRWDESLLQARRQVELSPKDPNSFAGLIEPLEYMGLWEEAEAAAVTSANLKSDPSYSERFLARLGLFRTRDFETYRATMQSQYERLVYADKEEFLRLTRRFDTALAMWEAFPDEMISNMDSTAIPKSFYLGYHLRALGRSDEAERRFKEAAHLLEQELRAMPDDGYKRSYLALAYAGMGRKEEALREATSALDSNPETKDAIASRDVQKLAAEVYARAGAPEKAITLLEHLVMVPYGFSTGSLLPFDPAWDALRGNPRFDLLVAATKPVAATPTKKLP